MTYFGYDSTLIAESKALLSEKQDVYNLNKTVDDEKFQLKDIFSLHRKKAKVVFRKDSLTVDKLTITDSMSHAYTKCLEVAKKFYSVVSTGTEIQTKLARLRVSFEDITAANTLIVEVETVRTEYLREKGESQDATKAKDAAFAEIDDWMSEFYAVVKIGLEDNPQLLEALGKTIKS